MNALVDLLPRLVEIDLMFLRTEDGNEITCSSPGTRRRGCSILLRAPTGSNRLFTLTV